MGQNLVYLAAAYAIIWIVLLGYIFFLTQQVSDLRGQLDALRRGPGGKPAVEREAPENRP